MVLKASDRTPEGDCRIAAIAEAPTGDPFQLYKDGICAVCIDAGLKTKGATYRCTQCLHEFCRGCLPEHECDDWEREV